MNFKTNDFRSKRFENSPDDLVIWEHIRNSPELNYILCQKSAIIVK